MRMERLQSFATSVESRLGPRSSAGLGLLLRLVLLILAAWAVGSVVPDRPDHPIADFIVHHRAAWLTPTMRLVTTLGSGATLAPVILVVGLALAARRRRWGPMVLLASAYLGSLAVYNAVKVLVGRPRPTGAQVVVATGYAFPSGHAMQSAAVAGALAVLGCRATSRPAGRVAVWSVAALFGFLVGCSRLYLGVHWTSDVLAGWVLGAVWLRGLAVATRSLPDPPRRHVDETPPRGSRT